jgi:hypothetical protein
MKRSAGGAVVWIAVKVSVDSSTRIGLIAHTAKLGLPIRTYGYDDIVFPTDNGSLGQRAAMWDAPTVFGVHPGDWQYLIVPDINNNSVKVSHNGGKTWTVDAGLTAQVLRGGELKLWDDDPYWMQVTDIAFDPYTRNNNTRIFVGTREAGIICSADNGRNWSTIRGSDNIKYITGFHFLRNGGVYVSSFGQGLWFVKPTSGCPESYSLPWDRRQPLLKAGNEGAKAVEVTKELPAPPRGTGDPGHAQLYLLGSIPSGGVDALGPDNVLKIAGRGFPPRTEITLLLDGSNLRQNIHVDKDGQFSATVVLPADLRFAIHNIEAAVKSEPPSQPLAAAKFVKPYFDESKNVK